MNGSKGFIPAFSVMYKDEKVADVLINEGHHVSIKKYTNVKYKQPFLSERQDIFYIYDFVKSRCYEDGREDLPEILNQAGMKNNNPWLWIRLTHGVTYDDFWWICLPEERLTWEDVRIR